MTIAIWLSYLYYPLPHSSSVVQDYEPAGEIMGKSDIRVGREQKVPHQMQ